MFVREVTVVFGCHLSAVIFGNITSGENPFVAQGGQAFFDVALEVRIAPRARAVVDADGCVLFYPSIRMLGLGKRNLPERNLDARVLGP